MLHVCNGQQQIHLCAVVYVFHNIPARCCASSLINGKLSHSSDVKNRTKGITGRKACERRKMGKFPYWLEEKVAEKGGQDDG